MIGPACSDVLALLQGTVFTEGHLEDQVERIRTRLQAPLTVAVAGRVSVGKSTLVNALLNSQIAPTGAGETTRVLYRFESGHF
jgi:GTP-binding protein EngB required for normal cell division